MLNLYCAEPDESVILPPKDGLNKILMSLTKLPLLFGVLFGATALTYATTITFTGPDFPNPTTAKFGQLCNPATDIGCIFGDPTHFEVFSASITQPSGATPWVLQIKTNYGFPNVNLIPGNPDIIPAYVDPQVGGLGGPAFGMGDALFFWNGNTYGVVMTPHDGYLAGNIYVVNGQGPGAVQTSGQILGAKGIVAVNPNGAVLLAAGGTLAGTGAFVPITGSTGDSVNTAHYTITDQFTAPANFLANGTTFGFDFTSYACANSVVVGNGGFTGGAGGGVPEPGTLLLCAPALLLLGFRLARQRGRNIQTSA